MKNFKCNFIVSGKYFFCIFIEYNYLKISIKVIRIIICIIMCIIIRIIIRFLYIYKYEITHNATFFCYNYIIKMIICSKFK